MDPLLTRRSKSIGLLVATISGLVVIELIYDRLMPTQLQVGQLLASSFNVFTYPLAYWFAHLVLTVFLLGGIAWLFQVRGGRLLRYLLLVYFISLLGPIWILFVDIYVLPPKRSY
ncbi:MAG: hypothetical protein JWN15_735 [Firmicutes bacterium]|nr:hypothetical protein [Bacillota bacterium]